MDLYDINALVTRKTEQKFFKLLKNAHVLAPEDLGVQDVLVAGDRIARIAPAIDGEAFEAQVIDVDGSYVSPGFIDAHVHMLGGGGGAGYGSRAPELQASEAFLCGTTTIIGCLGIDYISRTPIHLVCKCRSLQERGLNVYIVFGGFGMPPRTITGDIRDDMFLIPELLGVGEPAISDPRSSQAPVDYLQQLVSEVHVGGRLTGKHGIVQFHLGDAPSGTAPLHKILEVAPMKNVRPLHFNRNEQLMEEAPAWIEKGGYVDFTAALCPPQHKRGFSNAQAVQMMRDKGVDLSKITFSTDGNGVSTLFGIEQIERFPLKLLHQSVVETARLDGMSVSQAVSFATSNTAESLGLKGKGRIAVGMDADLVVLDKGTLDIKDVISRGLLVVENGERVNRGRLDG